MLDLTLHSNDDPIPLRNIAKRQDISEHYLEQLISSLRKAGLVQSVRGAHGGYKLAKKPEKITVGDVLRALEGPFGLVDCVLEQNAKKCSKYDDCITRSVWAKIRDGMIETADSITLEDICNNAN